MFTYWQSYEIDGSDTCYNLVVPEREKCIALLSFYFKLKIIHKGKPVKIYRATGKDAKQLTNKIFMPEDFEDLWDTIRTCDLKYLELQYTYVSPNTLYPEVKRELIDMLTKHAQVNHQFVNPVFSDAYCTVDYVTINFACKPEGYHYEMACSERYYAITSKCMPFLNILFNCSLGGPYELMFYGLSRISEAFPEFETDMQLNDELLSFGSINWDELVKEGIVVESSDYAYTLERILTHPLVSLNKSDNGLIHLNRLPSGIENFDPLKIYIGDGGYTEDELNRYVALKGIFGKSTLSITEYVDKVHKLANAAIFSDANFEIYTSFAITVQTDKVHSVYCTAKLIRSTNKPKLLLLVPYKYRDRIEKLLSL